MNVVLATDVARQDCRKSLLPLLPHFLFYFHCNFLSLRYVILVRVKDAPTSTYYNSIECVRTFRTEIYLSSADRLFAPRCSNFSDQTKETAKLGGDLKTICLQHKIIGKCREKGWLL